MLLSFVTLYANGEHPSVDAIKKNIKRVIMDGGGISSIICEPSFDVFIPNVQWIVHQMKLISGKEVVFAKTTYSSDHSIAINHYRIGA